MSEQESTMRPSMFRRRNSNSESLASSVRLTQLRSLQTQLSAMITHDLTDGNSGLDLTTHSTMSLHHAVNGIDSSYRDIDASSRSAMTLPADIESGMKFTPSSARAMSQAYPAVRKKTTVQQTPKLDEGRPSGLTRKSSAKFVPPLTSSDSQNSLTSLVKSSITSKQGSDTVSTAEVATSFTASLDGSNNDRGRKVRKPQSRLEKTFSRRNTSLSSTGSVLFRRKENKATFNNDGKEKNVGQLPTYDFLSKQDEEKEESSLQAGRKWWHGVFFFSVVSMLACIITLWAPYPYGARMPSEMVAQQPWSTGCKGISSCICPRETICADDLISMIFLTISRSTAWFDYPLYMLLFMSKANNLNNFLQKTALRCWINFSDYHKVHSLFGIVVAVESTSHSFFHLLRWARRNDDIQFLWTTTTGITGLIAITLCPLIVLPMTLPCLKKRMRFEWRKALHYLSIVWGAALMHHAPERIFWLIGVPIFIYTADKIMEGLFKTHLLESAHFQRLGETSCIISFENPPGFGKQNSAYVYLMLPWLSKYQFHAFTVFPHTKPNHSSICISKCGDWTEALMKQITTPIHKPAFVVGPFLSPFSSPAMDSENLVAVASGIGVTPAISLIKQYASTHRRLNLVWICRDAGLVEHFLANVDFGGYGYTLIYYTGKREIVLTDDLPPNVFIFNGRSNLDRTISGIIHSIVSGEGLPEELNRNHRVISKAPAEVRSKLLLEKALSIYTMDQLFDYTVKASSTTEVCLLGAVNFAGILSTMRNLLGDDCELVTDKIMANFERINVDGSYQLNRDEFEEFMMSMLEVRDEEDMSSVANARRGLDRMKTAKNLFDSKGASSNKDEFGIRRVLQGNGKFSAKNWNMLYCGGSEPVLLQLKAYKRKYAIGLSVEKFDW